MFDIDLSFLQQPVITLGLAALAAVGALAAARALWRRLPPALISGAGACVAAGLVLISALSTGLIAPGAALGPSGIAPVAALAPSKVERLAALLTPRLATGPAATPIAERSIRMLIDIAVREEQATDAQLAYILATAHHETARTMKPIAEYGQGQGHAYGRRDRATGRVYYGRGFCQLTHRSNYRQMSDLAGVDLQRFPELAHDVEISARVCIRGILEGAFGDRLDRHVSAERQDFVGARRSVNPGDARSTARAIAKKADALLAVIRTGQRVAGLF